MKSLLLTAALASLSFAQNTPIPERHPGFGFGSMKSNIQIEFIYDITCSDCRSHDPITQAFLDSPWHNSTVREEIFYSYTLLPLPYHHESWVPHKLIPMILDECYFTDECHYYEYINFTLTYQDLILKTVNVNENDIIDQWTQFVAMNFNYTLADLQKVYTNDDTHDSEGRMRYMWKYAASRGITGTPSAIVNGVPLTDYPETVEDWISLIDSLYEAQQSTRGF